MNIRMANRSTVNAIDEYIAGFPPETQTALEALRALIKTCAPGATETVSYAIPTFDLNGKHLVHFAGYARQFGLYPAPSGLEAFKEDLKLCTKRGKGSVQFPLSQPLPTDLIRRNVEFRVTENMGKASKQGGHWRGCIFSDMRYVWLRTRRNTGRPSTR